MFRIFPKSQADYKVIELEAENNKLKDELIIQLQSRIRELEILLKHIESFNQIPVDSYIPSNDEVIYKSKPVLRTIAEVVDKLESISLKKAEYAKKIDHTD